MERERGKLKLGKGAAFVKSRLNRLCQEDDTWEADFRALPKPMMQFETHYLGLVVTESDGFLLADLHVEYTPTVNDLATLLAHAMKRPLSEGAHRPRRIHVRKNPPLAGTLPGPGGTRNRGRSPERPAQGEGGVREKGTVQTLDNFPHYC